MSVRRIGFVLAAIMLSVFASYVALAQQPAQPEPMRFFVTSAGSGMGGNLGGLAGADKRCQTLAAAVGAGNRTWRAYLSVSATGTQPAVNARDRIGLGPWHNAKGVLIAASVVDLHGDVQRDRNTIARGTALTEKGGTVNGVGDAPTMHDILTGSDSTGRALLAQPDQTCGNWTSSSTGAAMVGHHDRTGGGTTSWNSAHSSKGCSQENLVGTGGAGLFYCFAID